MVLYILSIILLSSTAYAKSSRVVRYYGTEITVMSPPLAPETNEWGGYIDVYFDSDNEPEMLVRQGEELYLSYKQGPNETGTYYKQAHGKSGEALKTAFYQIIKNP